MSKKYVPYAEAMLLAEELVEKLRPACERIEIAGSLRRRKYEVGDIELVAIPRFEQNLDLFGEPIGEPYSLVDELTLSVKEGFGALSKNGPAYKQFTFSGMSVDLFLAHQTTWGVLLLLRTGNAEFSHWIVSQQQYGGALPFGMYVRDGRVWSGGNLLDTPEEQDVFKAIGLDYIEPVKRSELDWFQRKSR